MKHAFLRVFAGAMLFAFLFAAALPVSAFADEGTPPPPTEEPSPPEEGGETAAETVSEEPAVEETVVEESSVEEPVIEESVVDETVTEEVPVAELAVDETVVEEPVNEEPTALLADLPEDTELIVLDAAGEPLPLASEEAAEVFATGDPIWCPAGVTPPVGGGGVCSPSYASLADLQAWLVTNDPNVNGVIWIEKPPYADPGGIFLDGGTLTNMATKTLTIKGGWNGLGTSSVDTINPSQIGDRIWITGWLNDVTLSDLIVDSASSQFGLMITTTGKVTLTNVDITNGDQSGANIDNSAGTKDVVINNSEFSGNGVVHTIGGTGLTVYSNGLITLTDVTANTNFYEGARLDNTTVVAKGVTLNGVNIFGENGSSGLVVLSNGIIKVNQLIANSNSGGHGAYLDNSDASTPLAVTISKASEFKFNNDFGLVILSKGAITLKDITATNNTNWEGAYLDNCAWDSGACTSSANVTLTGANLFTDNGADGLVVYSGGVISLSNVIASWNGYVNGGDGGHLDNSDAVSAKAVTLTGANVFEGNEDDGLEVDSKGAINVSNLTANDNDYRGTSLDNSDSVSPQAVTITSKAEFQWNGSTGLDIESKGAITVYNIFSNDNDWEGAFLRNDFLGAVGAVTVTGTSTFTTSGSGFWSNNWIGLEVYSNGAITLKDLDFLMNDSTGLYAVNTQAASAPITVGTTLTPYCSGAQDNYYSGMAIYSNGVITMNRICNVRNGDYGAYIDNSTASTPKAVTFTGFGRFTENGLDGLHVLSDGAITTINLTAWGNGFIATPGSYMDGFGVYLDNCDYNPLLDECFSASAPQNVTMNGYVSVGNNFYSGLAVYTYGAITANNVYAENNGFGEVNDLDKWGYGALLANDYGTLPKPVTLNGTNEFFSNWSGGLVVDSLGAIKVNNLDAWNNVDGWGALLGNTAGVGGISVTGHAWVSENASYGLWAGSTGVISLANVDAWNNGSAYGQGGVILDNTFSGDTKPQNVTITGSHNWFEYNDGRGLDVHSYGMISLTNLDAYNNGWGATGTGVLLDNNDGFLPRSVVVNGSNYFEENEGTGLWVESLGAITVNNVYAAYNGGFGVSLENDFTGAVGGVTLNGTNDFQSNGDTGLHVDSYGAIRGNNLSAWDNDWDGISLDNDWLGSTTSATITLTGYVDVGVNKGDGLYALSTRAITISNIYTSANGFNGAWIDNSDSGTTSPQNVTITGKNEFYENWYNGLWVTSYGMISVSNITANDNGQYNFWAEEQIPPEPLVDEGRGVYMNNCGFDWGLWVQDCSLATSPKAINLTGTNTFVGNFYEGLVAVSLGAITGNNVTANSNGWGGAYLDNQWDQLFTGQGVKLTGANHFEGNGEDGDSDGLLIYSHGGITLSNVTANWNWGNGAYLDSYAISGAQVNVILTGTNSFNSNGNWLTDSGAGLHVLSEGNITISNLTANWNGAGGAYLDNYAYNYGNNPLITLTGVNSFLGNNFDGLQIDAWGAVSLSKVVADGNGTSGVGVTTQVGNITLTCGSVTNNGWLHSGGYGLYLDAGGTITLKGVWALGNWVNTAISPFPPIVYRSC